ncbi:MAG: DUF4934 domain-containing protein [Bacteroidales bacterium]|nr:DUF4934 domain-containing protein [Bacteroidales bacterium]
MKKKTLLAGGLSLLLLSACSSGPAESGSDSIDIAGSFEQPTELKVSQLGKNIRYVPLETTDSSLIGGSPIVQILKDKILITTDKRSLLFDKASGKFLRSIGQKGNGPKDYSDPSCYVNSITGELCYHRQGNKMVAYNQEGKYLGEIILPHKLSTTSYFTASDSLLIGYYGEEIGNKGNSQLFYFNRQGEIKDSLDVSPCAESEEKPFSPADIASIAVFKSSVSEQYGLLCKNGIILMKYKDETAECIVAQPYALWHSEGKTRFRDVYGDTIYTLKGKELQPYLAFYTGQWHQTVASIGEKGTEDLFTVTYAMESPNSLFFQCIRGMLINNQVFNGIYDKKSGKTYMNKRETALTDDLTHFMPFQPETCSEEGEFAALLDIDSIREWLDEHPETAQEGKLEFLNTLAEDANPVCVIVEP